MWVGGGARVYVRACVRACVRVCLCACVEGVGGYYLAARFILPFYHLAIACDESTNVGGCHLLDFKLVPLASFRNGGTQKERSEQQCPCHFVKMIVDVSSPKLALSFPHKRDGHKSESRGLP